MFSVELRPLRAQFPRPELYAKARRKSERTDRARSADRAVCVHIHKASGVAPTRGAEPPNNGGCRRVVPILDFAVSGGVIVVLLLLVGLVCIASRNRAENLVLRKREKLFRRRGYIRLHGARGVAYIVRILCNRLEVRAEVGGYDALERRANCLFHVRPSPAPRVRVAGVHAESRRGAR